jgi:hypothetical protein
VASEWVFALIFIRLCQLKLHKCANLNVKMMLFGDFKLMICREAMAQQQNFSWFYDGRLASA